MNRYWKMKAQKSVDLDGAVREVIHIHLPDGRRVLCPDTSTARLIVICVNKHLRVIVNGAYGDTFKAK